MQITLRSSATLALVALCLVAFACTGDGAGGTQDALPPDETAGDDVLGDASGVDADADAEAVMDSVDEDAAPDIVSLGDASEEGVESPGVAEKVGECALPSALPGDTICQELSVVCPGVDDRVVSLYVLPPVLLGGASEQKGVIILGSGGDGTGVYDVSVGIQLAQSGFRVVLRSWDFSWEGSSTGAGVVAGACRYATVMHWIRSQPWSAGPLCASGNSGGGAEIAYFLTHWGGTNLLDLAVITGGPPMSRIDLGCLEDPDWLAVCQDVVPEEVCGGAPNCSFNAGNKELFDDAFEGTPCTDGDASLAGDFLSSSLLAPDAVLDYPATPVHFIQGAHDCTSAAAQGFLYSDAVTSEKVVEIADAEHGVFKSPDGAARIVAGLAGGCVCRHGDCQPTAP